ncbi:hypothetical protein [Bacillus atrophaeus]|uniref:hypothetical protein n=1 Tax=Bacillus atrophaeus TaxID=1452 RepID=UPI00240E6E1E|nr:hypothetical protein [Bacillus atrophaeus]MEC0765716.1 hypothetical protein [Bacillus atrophaeus]MEC0781517.1 hypothetical protein [Bacillus atrophaeus]MEC0810166.1 hypothetical protein [Bacillus atrophaeus]
MTSIVKMEQKHIDLMKGCAQGATIWGRIEAVTAREIQKFDPSFLEFIGLDELGEYDPAVRELTGAERLPYFGCVLTSDGIAYIDRWENENNLKGEQS